MLRSISKRLFGTSRTTSRRGAYRTPRRLVLEGLEHRVLMAVAPVATLSTSGVLSINGTDQADTISVRQDGTQISVAGLKIQTKTGQVANVAASRVKSISISGLGGNDVIRLDQGRTPLSTPAVIDGGLGNDLIVGGAGNDRIYGRGGNDILQGNLGNDTLDGGEGLDQLQEQGNVNFNLTTSRLTGLGTDSLAGIEQAVLTGGAGSNQIDASAFSGDVTLVGGAGDDNLIGGMGKSRLVGESGADWLYTGKGDTEFLGGEDGKNVIVGRPTLRKAPGPVYVPNDPANRKLTLASDPQGRESDLQALIDEFTTLYQDREQGFGRELDKLASSQRETVLANLRTLVRSLLEDDQIQDVRWMAYMLATAKRETAFTYFQEIKPANPSADSYWVRDGGKYFGRGYVQITWKSNYEEMGKALGIDLVNNPAQAADPTTAYKIFSYGMRTGFFNKENWIKSGSATGSYVAGNPNQWKGLGSYLNDSQKDYRNARQMVNFFENPNYGKPDSYAAVAADAEKFETMLKEAFDPNPPDQLRELQDRFNGGARQMREEAVGRAVAAALGADLPMVRESLAGALQTADRLQAAFPGQLDAGGLSQASRAASSPVAALSANAGVDAVETFRRQLEAAGLEVLYLDPKLKPDVNGDVLRVRYRRSEEVNTQFSVGGDTGFSYFDDRVNGNLSGELAAGKTRLDAEIVYGVEQRDGQLQFYVSDQSGLRIAPFTVDGSVSGQLAIRSLALVSATGQVHASLSGGLGLVDNDGTADGKVHLNNLLAGFRGDVDGQVQVIVDKFAAKVPVLGELSWSGQFLATIRDGVVDSSGVKLDTPDAMSILKSVARGLFNVTGKLPILGGIGDLLGRELPLVKTNLMEQLGIGKQLGWLITGGGLSNAATSLEKLRDELKKNYNVTLLPGVSQITVDSARGVIEQLIRGDRVDLVRYETSGGKQWDKNISLFQVIIPILPPALVAKLGANIEPFAGWNYYVGLGVDTTGFYIDPNTRIGVNGGVRFNLSGGVSLAGLLGVNLVLGAGIRVEAGVRFNDPDPSDGKIYFDELFNGQDANRSFLDSMEFYARGDVTGHLRVELDLPWPLPDMNLVNEEMKMAPFWSTQTNRTVKETKGDGKSTYRILTLPSDKPLDLASMVVVDASGARILILEGANENDSVRLSRKDGKVNVAWFGVGEGQIDNIQKIKFVGAAGNDRLEATEGFDVPIWANGGEGDDMLIGGGAADTLLGGSDRDELIGQGGADRLEGGSEDDVLRGGSGDDTLLAGQGNDALYGDGNNDRLEGGDGDDNLDGGFGNDTLLGQAGTDYLQGGDDHDKLEGGLGTDIVIGGVGNDRLIGGADSADDPSGSADASDDQLYGGTGNDTLDGGFGSDVLLGQEGNDTLLGQEGKDRLDGGDGDDRLEGGSGEDILHGGAGRDTMFGNADDDILNGGADQDVMYGDDDQGRESGRDRFEIHFASNQGSVVDEIYGGLDRDYIVIVGMGKFNAEKGTYSDECNDEIHLSQIVGTETFVAGWREKGTSDDLREVRFTVPADVDAVIIDARGGDDLVAVADTATAKIEVDGGAGNDTIYGGAGDDILRGGDGDDAINGRGGQDEIHGGAGNDTLDGGVDGDVLYGEEGNDTITGGAGRDIAYGGQGNDTLKAGDGILGDVLFGELGNDTLLGGDGIDLLSGGQGNDILKGGRLSDVLLGGDDNDIVWGEAGADFLLGEGGKDELWAASPVDEDFAIPDWWKVYNDELYPREGELLKEVGEILAEFGLRTGDDAEVDPLLEQRRLLVTQLDGELAKAQESLAEIEDRFANEEDPLLPEEWLALDQKRLELQEQIQSRQERRDQAESEIETLTKLVDLYAEIETINLSENDLLPNRTVAVDFVLGGDQDDVLYGSAKNDLISGEGGDDTIYHSAGRDVIFGGSGDNDTYVVRGTEGADHIDFEYNDGKVWAKIEAAEGTIVNDQVTLKAGKRIRGDVPEVENFKVEALGGDDVMTLKGLAAKVPVKGKMILDGGGGDDTIDATTEFTIDGTTHKGYQGPAELYGGAGDDTLKGGPLTLVLEGGEGNNTLDGRAAIKPLTLRGGAGNDTIYGGQKNDTIYGGPGKDVIDGGLGNDMLYGDGGPEDTIFGGPGNDNVYYRLIDNVYFRDYASGSDTLDCLDGVTIRRHVIDTFRGGYLFPLTSGGEVWGGYLHWDNIVDFQIASDGAYYQLGPDGDLTRNPVTPEWNWSVVKREVRSFELLNGQPLVTAWFVERLVDAKWNDRYIDGGGVLRVRIPQGSQVRIGLVDLPGGGNSIVKVRDKDGSTITSFNTLYGSPDRFKFAMSSRGPDDHVEVRAASSWWPYYPHRVRLVNRGATWVELEWASDFSGTFQLSMRISWS